VAGRTGWGKLQNTTAGIFLVASVLATANPRDLEPQNPAPGENEVKAAFLYNFAKFVEWPTSAFPDANSPLIIAVVGEDPFGEVLDRTVAGKLVRGRPLQVRRWKRMEDSQSCNILFVSASERGSLPDILRRIHNSPVLTVGEWEGFDEQGGMIRFLLRDNRIQFEINNRSATESGLKISSRLLGLAVHVWE